MYKKEKIKHIYGILQKDIEMIIITSNISGEQYLKLIDYAFRCCDRFALNIPILGGDEHENERRVRDIVCQMRPYITDRMVSKKYFSIKSSYKREIYVFSTSKGVRNMVNSAGGIYKWVYPELPEDLSFFDSASGRCWLETIAHENECRIYSSSDADIKFLEDCGIPYIYDDQDNYAPYLKESAEYIVDGFSKVSYEIRDNWERRIVNSSDYRVKKMMYRHSVAGDGIDDIFIDVIDVSVKSCETVDMYILKKIKQLDEDSNVIKIAKREILIDGVSSIEYSYRHSGLDNMKYSKYIDIFSSVSENTVVIFRNRVFNEESEKAFRIFLDSVEMSY